MQFYCIERIFVSGLFVVIFASQKAAIANAAHANKCCLKI